MLLFSAFVLMLAPEHYVSFVASKQESGKNTTNCGGRACGKYKNELICYTMTESILK
jgi:hypothetical protein